MNDYWKNILTHLLQKDPLNRKLHFELTHHQEPNKTNSIVEAIDNTIISNPIQMDTSQKEIKIDLFEEEPRYVIFKRKSFLRKTKYGLKKNNRILLEPIYDTIKEFDSVIAQIIESNIRVEQFKITYQIKVDEIKKPSKPSNPSFKNSIKSYIDRFFKYLQQ